MKVMHQFGPSQPRICIAAISNRNSIAFQGARPKTHRNAMNLPSERDINPHRDNDGNVAAEHFFGKSLHDAENLFRENSLYYQEDLMWMGPKAFCFYVKAAFSYLQSRYSNEDADMVNCLHSTIKLRLEQDSKEMDSALHELITGCRYILANWSKFEVDDKIFGDLKKGYFDLVDNLIRIGKA